MLVERTASKKHQKILLGALLLIVGISGFIWLKSSWVTVDALKTLKPLPRAETIAVPLQSSRSVITNPVFKKLESSGTALLEIGPVGRSNPFAAPNVE